MSVPRLLINCQLLALTFVLVDSMIMAQLQRRNPHLRTPASQVVATTAIRNYQAQAAALARQAALASKSRSLQTQGRSRMNAAAALARNRAHILGDARTVRETGSFMHQADIHTQDSTAFENDINHGITERPPINDEFQLHERVGAGENMAESKIPSCPCSRKLVLYEQPEREAPYQGVSENGVSFSVSCNSPIHTTIEQNQVQQPFAVRQADTPNDQDIEHIQPEDEQVGAPTFHHHTHQIVHHHIQTPLLPASSSFGNVRPINPVSVNVVQHQNAAVAPQPPFAHGSVQPYFESFQPVPPAFQAPTSGHFGVVPTASHTSVFQSQVANIGREATKNILGDPPSEGVTESTLRDDDVLGVGNTRNDTDSNAVEVTTMLSRKQNDEDTTNTNTEVPREATDETTVNPNENETTTITITTASIRDAESESNDGTESIPMEEGAQPRTHHIHEKIHHRLHDKTRPAFGPAAVTVNVIQNQHATMGREAEDGPTGNEVAESVRNGTQTSTDPSRSQDVEVTTMKSEQSERNEEPQSIQTRTGTLSEPNDNHINEATTMKTEELTTLSSEKAEDAQSGGETEPRSHHVHELIHEKIEKIHHKLHDKTQPAFGPSGVHVNVFQNQHATIGREAEENPTKIEGADASPDQIQVQNVTTTTVKTEEAMSTNASEKVQPPSDSQVGTTQGLAHDRLHETLDSLVPLFTGHPSVVPSSIDEIIEVQKMAEGREVNQGLVSDEETYDMQSDINPQARTHHLHNKIHHKLHDGPQPAFGRGPGTVPVHVNVVQNQNAATGWREAELADNVDNIVETLDTDPQARTHHLHEKIHDKIHHKLHGNMQPASVMVPVNVNVVQHQTATAGWRKADDDDDDDEDDADLTEDLVDESRSAEDDDETVGTFIELDDAYDDPRRPLKYKKTLDRIEKKKRILNKVIDKKKEKINGLLDLFKQKPRPIKIEKPSYVYPIYPQGHPYYPEYEIEQPQMFPEYIEPPSYGYDRSANEEDMAETDDMATLIDFSEEQHQPLQRNSNSLNDDLTGKSSTAHPPATEFRFSGSNSSETSTDDNNEILRYLVHIPDRPSHKDSMRMARSARIDLDKLVEEEKKLVENLKKYTKDDEDLTMIDYVAENVIDGMEREREGRRRKKRDISDLDAKKLKEMLSDPNNRINYFKTLENVGTVTRSAIEHERAPLYHFRNALGSARDAVVAAMKITNQNFLIPAQYEIVKHDEAPQLAARMGTSSEQRFQDPVTETFQKVGSVVRSTVKSGQEVLGHIGEAANHARNAFQTTHQSTPRLIVSKIPAIEKARRPKLASRMFDLSDGTVGSATQDEENEGFVKVGHIMDAVGLSDPYSNVGSESIMFVPRSRMTTLKNRFRDTPRRRNQEIVGNTMSNLRQAQRAVGVHSLRDLLREMRQRIRDSVRRSRIRASERDRALKQANPASISSRFAEVHRNGQCRADQEQPSQNEQEEIVGSGLPLPDDLLHPFMNRASQAEQEELFRMFDHNNKKVKASDKHLSDMLGAINPVVFEKVFQENLRTMNNSDADTPHDLFHHHHSGHSHGIHNLDDISQTAENVSTTMLLHGGIIKPFMGQASEKSIKQFFEKYTKAPRNEKQTPQVTETEEGIEFEPIEDNGLELN